jgi:hypothetical protein
MIPPGQINEYDNGWGGYVILIRETHVAVLYLEKHSALWKSKATWLNLVSLVFNSSFQFSLFPSQVRTSYPSLSGSLNYLYEIGMLLYVLIFRRF